MTQTPSTPSLMWQEAESAPAVVAAQLSANAALMSEAAKRLRALDPAFVITIARGSSDHAASFAKVLIETRLQIPVLSQSPSLETLYGKTSPKLSGALVLAISQSGRSPDLIAAAKAARAKGAVLLALVNDTSSPLAEAADIVVPLGAGPEHSVAATKSFIASLSAITQLIALWGEDQRLINALADSEAVLQRAWQSDWSAALPPLGRASNLLILGRGLTWPIAAEAALKLKETAQIHAESFSSAEVAHGPMALVGEGAPVFAFTPTDAAASGFADALNGFSERGACVLAAAPERSDIGAETNASDHSAGDAPAPSCPPIWLPAAHGADPAITAIGMILSFYRMAEALAQKLGKNVDQPPHLAKVTKTL